MTQDLDLAHTETSEERERETGLSWPRIAGISFALALHAAALLLLLAPIAPPAPEQEKEDVVSVTFIEPPPPPPPPPPPHPPTAAASATAAPTTQPENFDTVHTPIPAAHSTGAGR